MNKTYNIQVCNESCQYSYDLSNHMNNNICKSVYTIESLHVNRYTKRSLLAPRDVTDDIWVFQKKPFGFVKQSCEWCN